MPHDIYLIKREEFKKFSLMALLIACILFNYHLIHSLKDSLVISAIGAEAVNFNEIYIILPAVFLSSLCYIKISSVITNRIKLFSLICLAMIVFFIIFAFILYPNFLDSQSALNKIATNELISEAPHLKWFIILYEKWPLCLFNIFSELWVGIMLSLLFWQLADSITTTKQAKRFYPLFTLIGNFALILSGLLTKYLCNHFDFITTMQYIVLLIAVIGMLCIILYRSILSLSLNEEKDETEISFKKTSKKISLRESLVLIFSSKYLFLIAIMVICYGVSISLSQGLWKAQIIKLHSGNQDYLLFFADYQKGLGIASIIVTTLAVFIIRNITWFNTAIITPLVMIGSGSMFFIWIFYSNFTIEEPEQYNFYLKLSVLVGAFHITISKALKFSFFDIAKELAYIPLDQNLREKGKAAVDMFGERFGKSTGYFIQSCFFMLIPNITYDKLAMTLLCIFVGIIILWISAIKMLSKEYKNFHE